MRPRPFRVGFPMASRKPVNPSNHWGTVATPLALPNSATQTASKWRFNLEPGDTCWVTSTSSLYVCRVATAGAAAWDNVSKSRYRDRLGGRLYCYTDNRWITPNDDNYTDRYYQWAESAGTGVDPIDEWEHQGIIVPPGTRLTKLHMRVRCNSTEVTDFEYVLYKTMPSTVGRWEGIGVDNDAEVVSTEIFRDNFFAPTGGGTAFTGNMADRHHRTVDLAGIANADFPDLGEWRLYIKPIGSLTATRYLQTSILMESEDL